MEEPAAMRELSVNCSQWQLIWAFLLLQRLEHYVFEN